MNYIIYDKGQDLDNLYYAVPRSLLDKWLSGIINTYNCLKEDGIVFEVYRNDEEKKNAQIQRLIEISKEMLEYMQTSEQCFLEHKEDFEV